MNNRRDFIKKLGFVVAFAPFTPSLLGQHNKNIIIYGYDWKYETRQAFREKGSNFFFYEADLYPNKLNREEYIHFPLSKYYDNINIYKYEYNYSTNRWDCKTHITDKNFINKMTYIKNGKTYNIRNRFSDHVGFSDICCKKIEFEIA